MDEHSPLDALRREYHADSTPEEVLAECLALANSNASHNTYITLNAAWSERQVAALPREHPSHFPLYGVPVSLKDCFDLAGFPTSAGSRFYYDQGPRAEDSAIAVRLQERGAILTGKTHLQQLAYGITGENPDFGDCLQPEDAALLTGGSSSGAAASVQEGSALAAIGTDTGGSIRTPAALCGLAGFRVSQEFTAELWRGGVHLSPTFDTLGMLHADLRDAPALANAVFDVPLVEAPLMEHVRIGMPEESFLHDCDDAVRASLDAWEQVLAQQGAHIVRFSTKIFAEAFEIFAPIQAFEAAKIHAGHFEHFSTVIAERLAWGASLSEGEIVELHERRLTFEQEMAALFAQDDLDCLLMPATPVAALFAEADQSEARTKILRYTVPVSLARLPAVTLPPIVEGASVGLQLASPIRSDATLLAFAASLAQYAAD